MYRFFQEVLHALFTLVIMETDPHCLDNICAAVCHMIMAQLDAIPLDQVIILVQNSDLYKSNYTTLMGIILLVNWLTKQNLHHL